MRPRAATDGRSHPPDGLSEDHHEAPSSVSIEDTSTVIGAGLSFNLDVPVGSDQYQYARVQIMGKKESTGDWRECAEIVVSRDSSESLGHSERYAAWKKVYSATYSKQAGDSYLTHKIFDDNTGLSSRFIALVDAVLTGTDLRLTFRNFHTGSANLWVKGSALLW